MNFKIELSAEQVKKIVAKYLSKRFSMKIPLYHGDVSILVNGITFHEVLVEVKRDD